MSKSRHAAMNLSSCNFHKSPNTSHYGSSLLHGQENPRKTSCRSYGKFECEFDYLVNVHEYHFSSRGSSRKRLRHEIEICEELSFENNATAFQENTKAGQWSDRNRWHVWSISNVWCGYRQAYCTVELMNPGRSKRNDIRRTSTSILRGWIASIACRRRSSGKYSQDSRLWASSKRFK